MMKDLFLKLIRENYYEDRTIGRVFINNVFFGFSLEDTVRPKNIKIREKTAIHEGVFLLKIKKSPSKNEERIYIENVPNFVGIQIHSGNDVNDTSGCILIGKKREYKSSKSRIYRSKEAIDELFNIVKIAENAYIEIINLNQV